MDHSLNSLEEVQVGGVARITDRNPAPWQHLQQLQRWKTRMQRLAQALATGNLQQASYEFEALMNDVSEPGQADPMAHPQFTFLGKALQSLDLAGAREAFALLQHEVPSLHHGHHHHEEPKEQPLQQEMAPEDDAAPRTLDVTA